MLAGQKLVAEDGHEVALFPLPILRMTQDEGSDFSHAGTYNIDLVGSTPHANLYAPCTIKLIRRYPDGNGRVWQSVDTVHLPNGDIDYLCIFVAHDNFPPYSSIGAVVEQGNVFYHTGTAGYVTGDHVHLCCGQGQDGQLVQRPSGNWDLSNRIHAWDGLYVNDTNIIQGYGHDWKEWDGKPIPPTPTTSQKKHKFPWAVAWKHWSNFKH